MQTTTKSQKAEIWEDYYPYESLDEKSAEELMIEAEAHIEANERFKSGLIIILNEIIDYHL